MIALPDRKASLPPTEHHDAESLPLVPERIAARLGPERVLRAVVADDHRLDWMKEQLRGPLLRARLPAVRGTWQREGEVRHLIANQVEDLTPLRGQLSTSSRDFH